MGQETDADYQLVRDRLKILHLGLKVSSLDDVLAAMTRMQVERDQLCAEHALRDEREKLAGERCGVSRDVHGCDWPDGVAEVVAIQDSERIKLIAENNQLRADLAEVLEAMLGIVEVANRKTDRFDRAIALLSKHSGMVK